MSSAAAQPRIRIDLSGQRLCLLAADGRVVTKEELRKQIWRCKVEDVTIRSSISGIREALGGMPLSGSEILSWLDEYLAEGIAQVEGMPA